MAQPGKLNRQRLSQKLLQQLLGPLLLAIGIFYFTFHTLSGDLGLYALLKNERELEVLKSQLADVTAKNRDLEHRVRLLSDGSLDLDLLDEQSRVILNEASPDEVEIPLAAPAPAGPRGN
jgi:cell division protein FtsB